MTGHTRDQLIDAWDAIDRMDAYDSDLEAIKSVLPERPKQTMAEFGWDQDKNFLWEAEHGGTKVAMLGYQLDGYTILTDKGHIDPRHLTPTGRRYKLVLDDGHPEYLDTMQDYENAPSGTVAAAPGEFPRVKDGSVWYAPDSIAMTSHETMAGTRRRVLRWEWEW